MLKISHINTFYGRQQALWDFSLEIEKGEIFALIGSNGAGKSTLLKTLSGWLHPASGNIEFLDRRIERLQPPLIVEMGMAFVPEGGRLFPDMTVRENLEMGAYNLKAWKQKKITLLNVFDIFPILKERQGQQARTLSGGEKQMLAIGRGLMSKPVLCMFDEPSYGLSPIFVREVFKVIKSLSQQGITTLLVEQNVRLALEIADNACVIENGRIAMEGACQTLLSDAYIKKAYLGL
jgi:branched-chain amino acid transport system ATP-binding protein